MEKSVTLTATFGPKSATGQKFAEIYADLEKSLYVDPNGKCYSSLGYTADVDKFGNVKIYGPEDQRLNAIDGSHPDFSELEDKTTYITQTLIDTATRHLILTGDEGREAMAEDVRWMLHDTVTARINP